MARYYLFLRENPKVLAKLSPSDFQGVVERMRAARACAPKVHALLALMHFHAARLPARTDGLGDLVLLPAQDRSRWEARHLALGFRHLDRSASGHEVSRFHLEAGIAALHASAPSDAGTDWPQILSLYDELVALWPTPVVRQPPLRCGRPGVAGRIAGDPPNEDLQRARGPTGVALARDTGTRLARVQPRDRHVREEDTGAP